jgi:hypothetical protein
MADLPKIKAIEVEFSDGSTVIVHEPKGKAGLKAFISVLPALTILQTVFQRVQEAQQGVIDGSPVDIPDSVIDAIYSLFGVMTELTVDEFEQLSANNQIALLQGFSLFAPKNQQATVVTQEALVVSTPMP